MAHFARVDENGIVRDVIVIDNEHLLDEQGQEQEPLGVAYLASIGLEGTWVQTSYTGSMRGRYAGVGMRWDGTEFVSTPESLTVDRTTFPADGTAAAVVTYRNRSTDAPATVAFDVNGAPATIAVTDGLAVLEVTATQAGPVDVSIPARPQVGTLALTAMAVQ